MRIARPAVRHEQRPAGVGRHGRPSDVDLGRADHALAGENGVPEVALRVDLVPLHRRLRIRPRQDVRLEVLEHRVRGEQLVAVGVVERVDKTEISRVPPEVWVVHSAAALRSQRWDRHSPRGPAASLLEPEARRRRLDPPQHQVVELAVDGLERDQELCARRRSHSFGGAKREGLEAVGVTRLRAAEDRRHRGRLRAVVQTGLLDRHDLRVAEPARAAREGELVGGDRDARVVVSHARIVGPQPWARGEGVARERRGAPRARVARGGVGYRDGHDQRETRRVLLDQVDDEERVVVLVVDDLRVERQASRRVRVERVQLDRRDDLHTRPVVDRHLRVDRHDIEAVAERARRVGRSREGVGEPVESELERREPSAWSFRGALRGEPWT